MENITAITTALIAGFLANYLIERYKEYKKLNRNYEDFKNNVNYFIKLTKSALEIQVAPKKQPELDKNAGIKNLKHMFNLDSVYKELIIKLIFFNYSELNEKDYNRLEEIKDKIRKIQLKIFQIDTSTGYKEHILKFNLAAYKEIMNLLNEIDEINNKMNSQINTTNFKKNNLIQWGKELLILFIGTIIGMFVVSNVDFPEDFFKNLVTLNATFLMGIGAIMIAILSLYKKALLV